MTLIFLYLFFVFQPRLQQPTRSDPQIPPGDVPSVLPGVRQGHWIQKVGLTRRTDVKSKPSSSSRRRNRWIPFLFAYYNEKKKKIKSPIIDPFPEMGWLLRERERE